MSKKHKKDTHSPVALGEKTALAQAGGCAAVPDALLAAEAGVHELIAGQHSKAAVEAAKELHKRWATPASQSLLIEAYQARIRDLLRLGMLVEARSLVDLVIERFPSALVRLEEVLFEVSMSEGNLDDFVAPLKEPGLPPATRQKIEATIRQQVFDLSALSRASSLPPNHSLREAAAVVMAAFEQVTRGPVEPSGVLLPQVSRQSPLASWKALVNAIATFHQEDDAACRRWLQAIAPDSVPARLVPAIQVMLGSGMPLALNSAARKLVAATGAGGQALRPALTSLESAFEAKKPWPIVEKANAALSACEQFHPELCDKLRQHIAIRCTAFRLGSEVQNAVRGSPRKDARWYQLTARAAEDSASYLSLGRALVGWAAFRERALEEKWFAANSPEDGVLWLHMAELAADMGEDEAEDFLWFEPPPRSMGTGGLTVWQLFSPDVLYERACRADPHIEAFQSWLSWAKKQRDWRVADRAAECWHQSREMDVAPLLWLMESSEKRNAYQKSLKYLARAEQLDRLNPEVRKAKLRLLLAGVLRHFRQRKPHLASEGIERIEALAEPGGTSAALVSVLRRASAALNKDARAVGRYHAEVVARLGHPVAAYVLERAVGEASLLAPEEKLLDMLDVNSHDAVTLLKGLAKACVLGESVGIHVVVPETWAARLAAWLVRRDLALDTAETLVIGEAAIRSQESKLAFAASVAGMARGGADARFLFLRARALPLWTSERRYDCLSAALELARRERDAELVGKLLEALRYRPRHMFEDDVPGPTGLAGYSMEPGFLNEVLESERGAKEFPVGGQDVSSREAFSEEHESREEEPEAFRDFLANMPPEVLRALTTAIAQGGNPEEILKGILPGEQKQNRELEPRFEFLAPDLSREIGAAIAWGASGEEILAAIEGVILGGEPAKTGSQGEAPKKKEKPGAVPPQQGSLF